MTTRSDRPTAASIARELGVSYRQLNYWIKKGYLSFGPFEGSGHWLHLNAEQEDELRLFIDLVRDGYRLDVAARASHR